MRVESYLLVFESRGQMFPQKEGPALNGLPNHQSSIPVALRIGLVCLRLYCVGLRGDRFK